MAYPSTLGKVAVLSDPRSAVRDIVGELLTQNRVSVPGIRQLAARVHVPT